MKKPIMIILSAGLILSLCGVAFALTEIWSNTVTHTVEPAPTATPTPSPSPSPTPTPPTVALSTNGTDPLHVGDTIALYLQISNGASGATLYVFENNTQIGTATTDAFGSAVYYRLLVPADYGNTFDWKARLDLP